ncbi:MAG: hypothetical protein N2312_01440, partial [Dictyoglomaceae bacterium]|nr:hypothetical protein [Dictyoglomaceae bacterium]
SRVYGYNYELWDLNPILDIIHKTAIMKPISFDFNKLFNELKNSKKEFIPQWSNINYWHPQEFLPLLFKTWGFVHSLEEDIKYLFIIPLLKVTKYFSFDDEKVHKLYRSKYSIKKIEELLDKNWEEKFYEMLIKEIKLEYELLNPKPVESKIKVGIDVLEMDLENEANLLITSPPYLQAQEYIRSTKMELFRLGYNEEYIRILSKKEIPYRNVSRIKIYSEKYYEYRERIEEDRLKNLYDNYFHSILYLCWSS